MLIKEVFETKIEEKIDPVIKVGERENGKKLAAEIGNYVVTPAIESLVDDVLEHYTDSILSETDEIGIWISGYFGSGKSHLAKLLSLLIENRTLDGISATERFKSRLPPYSEKRDAITRHLSRIEKCNTTVLAFNLNTLTGSKQKPLPELLLNQYYISKGYSANHIFAKVIESELDKSGKLEELHAAIERLAKKPWTEIQKNPSFYWKKIYDAVCEIAPENFSTPAEVQAAMKNAESGDIYNTQFLVTTIINDLKNQEKRFKKPCRFAMVMDETGQWIGDDGERLHLLQALVEDAGSRGQGKIWIVVTTHEDMGSIIRNAKGLKADMKKIEARFRYKISLTTENIERVLEDRLLKKNVAGRKEIVHMYNANPGVLRGMGQLENTDQKLPDCTEEGFVKFYPFFPYQIHLIPEIVKSLRSSGGRGEQLSGSTRTLLAITQDIITAGRRHYLKEPVGELVSFDEVYKNLEGSEVNPDVRKDLARIEEKVPDATPLTRRVAEVLYLIREIGYIPKSVGNIARLLVEKTDDDLTLVIRKITPELEKLHKAKIIAKIGEEYEFLTKEGRNFEDEVTETIASLRWSDVLEGVAEIKLNDIVSFSAVPLMGWECPVRILFDDNIVAKDGDVTLQIYSPLSRLEGTDTAKIEDESVHQDNQNTIFVLSSAVPHFDENVKYFIATKRVINQWKGDPHKSEEAHKHATEREQNDLEKLRKKIQENIRDGIRNSQVTFKGSTRALAVKRDQTPSDALKIEIAQYLPNIYTKFEKMPYRPQKEQALVVDILKGEKSLTGDMKGLKIFDKAGNIDKNSPLLFEIRSFIKEKSGGQKKERVLGSDLIERFTKPVYGWHQGAVRSGVAALVRSGDMKVIIQKATFTNPQDNQLQNALKNLRDFGHVQLEIEEADLDIGKIADVRKILIPLIGKRNIPENPAGIAGAMETFAKEYVEKAKSIQHWADPAGLPVTKEFEAGKEVFERFLGLTNPNHLIAEIDMAKEHLQGYKEAIGSAFEFIDKWGKAFTDMRDFAAEISAVHNRLEENGRAQTFLKNWKDALNHVTVMDEEVWKTLQQSRTAAQTEITEITQKWRDEAFADVAAAEEIVQKLYADAGLENTTHQILSNLKNDIDAAITVVDASQIQETIQRKIQQILQTARAAIKKTHPDIAEKKQTESVKIFGQRKSQVVTDEGEWETFNEDLDARVRKVLREGKNVELK